MELRMSNVGNLQGKCDSQGGSRPLNMLVLVAVGLSKCSARKL
jgi:hypothetical protein